ncbi:MAG TPA: choice-of-anchor D domain-containing protein [Terriglobia bacterium]|nr:choice-of-anchor D domain-containing protein [Terriglobia bacterium]
MEDAKARYPVVVDPFVQLAKLTASDAASGDFLGNSVGISGDGSTIVAGAPGATIGSNVQQDAAYVFGGLPLASPSTTSLTFASQLVGTTSTAQTVTLTNTGNFAETNNCGSSLAQNASCQISVTFTPQSVGLLSGTLTITDNSNGAAGSMQTVSLSGTGTAPFTITPTPSTETITRFRGRIRPHPEIPERLQG